MAHFDVDPKKLVMIGDRYSTDVLFGNLHGTILDAVSVETMASCSLTVCIKLCTLHPRVAHDPHGSVHARRRKRREHSAAAHREGDGPSAGELGREASSAPIAARQ